MEGVKKMSSKTRQALTRGGKTLAAGFIGSYAVAIMQSHTFGLPEATWTQIVGGTLVTAALMMGWKFKDGPKFK